MTLAVFLKACLVWLLIAGLAVVNGIIREKALIPAMGHGAALPLSGILLAAVVFGVTYAVFDWFGKPNRTRCLAVGAQWLVMTLAFEFLFGHFVAGKPWAHIVRVFNPLTGDLFVLVLLVTLLSPLLVAGVRR